MIFYLSIVFVNISIHASTSAPKGLKCFNVDTWEKLEKKIFKKTVTSDNITKFFFLPSEVYIKKNDFCVYKNDAFRAGFKENDIGGRIIFAASGKIKPYKKVLWLEYGIYKYHYMEDKFNEIFRLKIEGESSPEILPKIKHNGYFWSIDYIPFVIVTYDNKEKHLFASKIRLK